MIISSTPSRLDAALDIIAPRADDPDRAEELAVAAAEAVKQILRGCV